MIEQGLGYSYEGVERTVDSHVRNLRRKLEEAGAPADFIETVFGVGYRLAPSPNFPPLSPPQGGEVKGGTS
jgi:two-component system alkaline phosphatase synthesis response regulator PhoP